MFLDLDVSAAPGMSLRQNHVPICSISDGDTAVNVPVRVQQPPVNRVRYLPASDGTLLVVGGGGVLLELVLLQI